MKAWLEEDIFDELDFDLLEKGDEDEIKKAFDIRQKTESVLNRVRVLRDYSEFVFNHLREIKDNIFIVDDILAEIYEIRSVTTNERLTVLLSDECKAKLELYNKFWEDTLLLQRIDLRVPNAVLPSLPFEEVCEVLKKSINLTFDRDKKALLKDAAYKVNNCSLNAKNVEKLVGNLLKYDICSEYENFNEELLGTFEQLMGSSSSFLELTVEELDEREDYLNDWLDQYDFIVSITDEALGKA